MIVSAETNARDSSSLSVELPRAHGCLFVQRVIREGSHE
ncbi:hypothetical protein AKJ09_07547 [Labilithrix luteola]|uniref:Uncharacterized protein n=1 Tax=Labilithrix luteola TaxID=1391654 RepID=A0A0K1Q589_9BACT|nr:hypothetical protein AKJ09_07547 [Labilithrix luteola]